MLFQTGRPSETLGANVAFKRTFARVRSQVVFERSRYLANFAPMRLLSRVQHAVVLQGGQMSETLLANVALKRT